MPTSHFKPDPNDFVILVMGPTGSGKTNFINCLTGNPSEPSSDVTPYQISLKGLRVVLVDTPGFDNTHFRDIVTLILVADWLLQKYPDGNILRVSGIIYVHQIIDNSMSSSACRSMQVFSRLCGNVALPRTSLVTTMWDLAKESVAIEREAELITNFWKEPIGGGATTYRFHNTPDSARSIVDDLLRIGNSGDKLHLQLELVEQKKHLHETEAGKLLYDQLQTFLANQKRTYKEFVEETRLQKDSALATSLEEECKKIDAQIRVMLEDAKEIKIPLSKPEQDDFVILVMGPTGSGKTNFIHHLSGNAEQFLADSFQSSTQDVTPYRIFYQDLSVVLVDTPGFNDISHQREVVRLIAGWLLQHYPDGAMLHVTGVIYLHQITDTRTPGFTHENVQVFGQLCGNIPLPRTRLVTTMWDLANISVATQREADLKTNFWRELVGGGATAYRFYNTSNSARTIIDGLLRIGSYSDELLLQEELVEQKEHLSGTEAGKILNGRLQELLAEWKRARVELMEEATSQRDSALVVSLQEEHEKIEDQLQETFEEMKEMWIPLSRRILLWLSRRKKLRALAVGPAHRNFVPAHLAKVNG